MKPRRSVERPLLNDGERSRKAEAEPSCAFSCCKCCSQCCLIFALLGALCLVWFAGLIWWDNITLKLAFNHHLKEEAKENSTQPVVPPSPVPPLPPAPMPTVTPDPNPYTPTWTSPEYEHFKMARVQACLIGAGIYFFVWILSIAGYIFTRGK